MSLPIGTRVVVYGGDGKTLLGEGEYVGEADVYVVRTPEGNILSERDATDFPTFEAEGDVEFIGGNPKLRMDDGTIKYGCQVWWKEKEPRPRSRFDAAMTPEMRAMMDDPDVSFAEFEDALRSAMGLSPRQR